MMDVGRLIWFAVIGWFRSRASLEAEILVLRHQLSVLQRKTPTRPALRNVDRLIFSLLYRVAPSILNAFTIVRLETAFAGNYGTCDFEPRRVELRPPHKSPDLRSGLSGYPRVSVRPR